MWMKEIAGFDLYHLVAGLCIRMVSRVDLYVVLQS